MSDSEHKSYGHSFKVSEELLDDSPQLFKLLEEHTKDIFSKHFDDHMLHVWGDLPKPPPKPKTWRDRLPRPDLAVRGWLAKHLHRLAVWLDDSNCPYDEYW